MNNRELRFAPITRAEEQQSEMILEGYAAVFDSETLIAGEWYEKIDRNAFDGADMSDVPLKYNHCDNVPILARTRNKSLELTVDDKGLKIRAKLLDTQDSKDVYTKIQNGLLDKMSFAFTIKDDKVELDKEGRMHRTILSFDKIFDVAIVDVPAYEDTEIYARSKDLMEIKLEALENEKLAEAKSKLDVNTRKVLKIYGGNF